MSNPKFSIITPIYVGEDHDKERRLRLFQKTIESVKNQTYDGNFEHIIVNDGSSVPLTIPSYPHIRIIDQPNLQRLTAYNTGFKNAKGEIFCLLDSDDEYEENYLERVAYFYEKWPKYKIFNFGATYNHSDGQHSERGAFKPKKKKKGHEVFGGGNIANGTFVFHRDVYDVLGAFPEGKRTIDVPWYKKTELFWTSPWDFSAYAQVEFPEIQPFFQEKHPDHPAGLPRELGNPYGQDYYLFYKYTRQFHSRPVDEPLLIVNLK